MQDTYRHKGLRKRLLERLYEAGIRDERVLKAMYQVPRHFFVAPAFESLAYQNKALPIEQSQTISQPYTVAYQTHLLEVKKREKVLEIGTGSGYQAAVLSRLGARVYTVERQEVLYTQAKKLLEKLELGVRCFFRDGHKGLAEHAPFDKIIVTAGASEKPKALLEQLAIGGRLVLPLGNEKHQRMYRITRVGAVEWTDEVFENFRFVPFLPGKSYK